ncbi:MAG: hypothetical protein JNL08_09825 [Planctomycetes bacterium]|nr:hypothetical protein [Planctomycetota bacterium]
MDFGGRRAQSSALLAGLVLAARRQSFGALVPWAMRFLALAFLRGDQQVWITATALESQWPELEATLREVMRGVTIAPVR